MAKAESKTAEMKGAKAKGKKLAARPVGTTPSLEDYKAILRPVMTEKSTRVSEGGKVVTFEVARAATKDAIHGAVERLFNVKVEAVRVANFLGKPKRNRGALGRRAAVKKAYVTLVDGEKISFVEGV
jgi:large subunit ribosomal protein L23